MTISIKRCDTRLPFVVLCVCAPVREYLCLIWRETHSKGLTTRSHARPEVNDERKVPEKKEG